MVAWLVGMVPRLVIFKCKVINIFILINFTDRSEEYALKWMTGILSSVAIILTIVVCFAMCIIHGRKRQTELVLRKYPLIPIESQAADYPKGDHK